MNELTDSPDQALEQLRAYLSFQILKIVNPHLKNHLDLSGIVRKTF